MGEAKESHKYQTFHKGAHQKLVGAVASKLELKPEDVDTKKLSHLADCIQKHVCHAQKVPESLADPALLASLREDITTHYDIVAEATRKYASGPLVKEISEELHKVVNNTSPIKLALYSGHDTGPILPLLHAFKVADGKWPPYASTIVLEVYTPKAGSGKKEHVVRMIYNGKALTIPACSKEMCPWETFAAVMEEVAASPEDCAEDDPKLAVKMQHWMGMFAATSDMDMLG